MSLLLNTPHSRSVVQPISSTMQHRRRLWQGLVDFVYVAASTAELAGAVAAAREIGIEYFVLGLGANILIGDKGFRGLIIRNTSSLLEFFPDAKLWVESGAVMAKLIPQAVERGRS